MGDTALSAAKALWPRWGTPCGALVKRWSNHNLFSLGPNWSPDGLISRVRPYSPPPGPPPACFCFPTPFKSSKISIWKAGEACLLESQCEHGREEGFPEQAKEASGGGSLLLFFFLLLFHFLGKAGGQEKKNVLFGFIPCKEVMTCCFSKQERISPPCLCCKRQSRRHFCLPEERPNCENSSACRQSGRKFPFGC